MSRHPGNTAKQVVVVYGASGHGKVVADAARCGGVEVSGFIDDGPGREGVEFFGTRVLGGWSWLEQRARTTRVSVVLGIGDNAARARLGQRCLDAGVQLLSVVHPRAVVAASAEIGPGTVVLACAVVNPGASVGAGVIVNTGAVVEHDVRVGDFAHLSPNATTGGAAVVGAQAHLGLGAAVLPLVQVGARAVVGAGAVIIRDVAPGTTVVGVPGRVVSLA